MMNNYSSLLNRKPTIKLFIDGKFVESSTTEWLDIHNPATNEMQLIKHNIKELTNILSLEEATTLADAEGDVFRGLSL
ncbi:hypothetical protein Q5P01_005173 [Channa striata]|uniref:Uncharacterized protein n=1 Tax=Channa striata TaxID=64152 RepID=A0AA88NC25_CHASR|nr:hypothetical protein Q5P01_005173 [Channa striata]